MTTMVLCLPGSGFPIRVAHLFLCRVRYTAPLPWQTKVCDRPKNMWQPCRTNLRITKTCDQLFTRDRGAPKPRPSAVTLLDAVVRLNVLINECTTWNTTEAFSVLVLTPAPVPQSVSVDSDWHRLTANTGLPTSDRPWVACAERQL